MGAEVAEGGPGQARARDKEWTSVCAWAGMGAGESGGESEGVRAWEGKIADAGADEREREGRRMRGRGRERGQRSATVGARARTRVAASKVEGRQRTRVSADEGESNTADRG